MLNKPVTPDDPTFAEFDILPPRRKDMMQRLANHDELRSSMARRLVIWNACPFHLITEQEAIDYLRETGVSGDALDIVFECRAEWEALEREAHAIRTGGWNMAALNVVKDQQRSAVERAKSACI